MTTIFLKNGLSGSQLVFYKTRTYITMVLIGEVRGKHKQCQVPGPAFFCIG